MPPAAGVDQHFQDSGPQLNKKKSLTELGTSGPDAGGWGWVWRSSPKVLGLQGLHADAERVGAFSYQGQGFIEVGKWFGFCSVARLLH